MTLLKEVTRNGYVFVERFMPSTPTLEILELLGKAVTLPGGKPVHRLRPQNCAPPNTYSGIFGFDAFPLHTDLAHWYLPPRYLMLRCVRGFDAVTTLFLDGQKIVAEIGETVLSRALVNPRRPISGKRPLLRLYQRKRGGVSLLRWDEIFICPATVAGEIGVRKLKRFLANVKCTRISLSSPGDTLVVDNWRMLHGRSAIPDKCATRVIERTYLEKLK